MSQQKINHEEDYQGKKPAEIRASEILTFVSFIGMILILLICGIWKAF